MGERPPNYSRHALKKQNMIQIKNPEELWTFQKAKLSLLFPYLHEEDFHFDYGKKDVMLELLQKKLGKSREELNLLLSGL